MQSNKKVNFIKCAQISLALKHFRAHQRNLLFDSQRHRFGKKKWFSRKSFSSFYLLHPIPLDLRWSIYQFKIDRWMTTYTSECDIPVPGIPGPGNLAPFWMVPVPVPEKIGPGKKYRYRYRKNLVPEKSTGPGTRTNSGYRHTLVHYLGTENL